MENLNEKAVYKLNVSCGRQGDLTGLFIAKKLALVINLKSNNYVKIKQRN